MDRIDEINGIDVVDRIDGIDGIDRIDRINEVDGNERIEPEIQYIPKIYKYCNQVKFGNITISEYSLGNILFRINIILKKTNVLYQFDQSEFKFDCYLFSTGRYCRFEIKIFLDSRDLQNQTYLIDINKIRDPSFIYRSFLIKFNKYFKSIETIEGIEGIVNTIEYNSERLIDSGLESIYKMSIEEISTTRTKVETLESIDFLVEILEYNCLHQYAINLGIHFKLCYLLMELEYEYVANYYELVDTILYMCWLLSMGWAGRIALNKCSFLVNFLHKKIHQDLHPFETYTLELSHLIMKNLESQVIRSD